MPPGWLPVPPLTPAPMPRAWWEIPSPAIKGTWPTHNPLRPTQPAASVCYSIPGQ